MRYLLLNEIDMDSAFCQLNLFKPPTELLEAMEKRQEMMLEKWADISCNNLLSVLKFKFILRRVRSS